MSEGLIQFGRSGVDPKARVVAASTHQLVKRFGETVACDHIDLQVLTGELVALVGLSGSGKSSLLRHLNGLHRPTSGDVHVLGVNVPLAKRDELRDLRQRVGFVFQQFGLVGRVSCLENVLHGSLGRLRGPRYGLLTYSPALRRAALAQLERVGLADRAFQRADTLSGGQQQRVAIARVLMQGPELVLADEPVASLDPESAARVMDLFFRICLEDGLTVICSLHQVELARTWAQRVVGMREGKIVLDRAVADLTTDDLDQVYRPRATPDA